MTGSRSASRMLFDHFFRRMFQNELVPDDADLADAIAWIVPMFAAPAALVTLWLFPKYALVADIAPEIFDRASRPDRLFFLCYSMIAAGLLSALAWSSLFPDRKDALVLGSLPVRTRAVVAARVAALSTFVLGIVLAVNLPAAGGLALAAGGSGTFSVALRHFFGHLIATAAAGSFVFLSLVGFQAALSLLLPEKAFRAVSALGQLLFVVILLEWLFFAPGLLAGLEGDEAALAGEGLLGWLPPFWFLGLYELLLGAGSGALQDLADTALAACCSALLLMLAAYAASYPRLARLALEVPRPGARPAWRRASAVRRWALALLLPRPAERAVFEFVAKTLLRSQRHRLLFAAYVALGLALVAGSFLGPVLKGYGVSFSRPTPALLSVPLVLSFFVLVALRVAFTVPAELGGNWIFRITETEDKFPHVEGARKAMLLLGAAPIGALTLPAFWAFWGWKPAVGHTLFWMLLAGLLVELLLAGFHKVPFTCSYLPGKANLKLLWPAYLLAMLTYAYLMARVSRWLLVDLEHWLAGCTLVAAALGAMILLRRRALRSEVSFVYDEASEPAVQVLGLAG